MRDLLLEQPANNLHSLRSFAFLCANFALFAVTHLS